MGTKVLHHYDPEDRGIGRSGRPKRFRWKPKCACGWVGIPARRSWAEQQYHAHVESAEHTDRPRRTRPPGPRPCTPVDRLPEELRP